jgi:transposase, IS30 family
MVFSCKRPRIQKEGTTMGAPNLTYDDRKVIEKMLYKEKSFQEIGDHLKRHRTSIDREVERNMNEEGRYCALCAQILYEKRKSKNRTRYVTENTEIKAFIESNIKQYAPDVIAGRSKREKNSLHVSQESIYKIIYLDFQNGGTLYKQLESKRKRRKSSRFALKDGRGTLKNQVSIRERPRGAENKSRHGHYEGDTILGKGNKSMCFTAIDRKNKCGFVHKLKTRDAEGVFEAVKLMKEYYGDNFKTLTVDNGKEFACHERIKRELGVDIYFADPGKPGQRGLNEHYNKMLRRYLPKGIDFRKVTWQYVRSIMNKINNTPRKSLQYRTPLESLGVNKFCAILN